MNDRFCGAGHRSQGRHARHAYARAMQNEAIDGTLKRLATLAGPVGDELFADIADLSAGPLTDKAALRVGTALRARYPADLVAEALTQVELRGRAEGKFSATQQMFFTRAGLEQSSGENVAAHRATRFAHHGTVADLCCGIGGDLMTLAPLGPTVAVDRDPVHVWMARHNVESVGGARTTVVQHDVLDVDLSGINAAFVDPARRSGHGRLARGRSEPSLEWCLGLAARVPAVGIKCAPGIAREAVPHGWELEFVSVAGGLKEAAVWSPDFATAACRATLLPGGHTLVSGSGATVEVREPGAFLLDPDPAVTRAGVVEDLAASLGAWKIDEQIAFLSTDGEVSTPYARTLRVLDSRPWNEKRLSQLLRQLDVGAVDIRRRGLAGDVPALHRSLKLSGSLRATLVMTRCVGRPWGLVCVDPKPDPAPQQAD